MLIGHSKLTHSYLMDQTTNANQPVCNTCNEILTIHHILYKCTRYTNQRRCHRISEEENNPNKCELTVINKFKNFLVDIKLIKKL